MVKQYNKGITKTIQAISTVKEEFELLCETVTATINDHKDKVDKQLHRLEEVVTCLSNQVEGTHPSSATCQSQQATSQKYPWPDTTVQDTPSCKRAASMAHTSHPTAQESSGKARTIARPQKKYASLHDFMARVQERDARED